MPFDISCAVPVKPTECQEDQALADRLRAENLARADAAPIVAEMERRWREYEQLGRGLERSSLAQLVEGVIAEFRPEPMEPDGG